MSEIGTEDGRFQGRLSGDGGSAEVRESGPGGWMLRGRPWPVKLWA